MICGANPREFFFKENKLTFFSTTNNSETYLVIVTIIRKKIIKEEEIKLTYNAFKMLLEYSKILKTPRSHDFN